MSTRKLQDQLKRSSALIKKSSKRKDAPLLPEAELGGPVKKWPGRYLREAAPEEKQSLANKLNQLGVHQHVKSVHFTPGAAEDARLEFHKPMEGYGGSSRTGRGFMTPSGRWDVIAGAVHPSVYGSLATRGRSERAWNHEDPTFKQRPEDLVPEIARRASQGWDPHGHPSVKRYEDFSKEPPHNTGTADEADKFLRENGLD